LGESPVRQLSNSPLLLLYQWLKVIEVYDIIDTTMDHPPPETPGLVIALEQTKGRGRTGPWISTRGGAWLTLFLEGHPSKGLALAIGGCLAEQLERLVPQARLVVKWPNDVYTSKGKLVGILVEYREGLLRIGVGVNVFNKPPRGGDNLYNIGYRGSLGRVYLAIVAALYNALNSPYHCILEAKRRNMLKGRIVSVVREDGSTVSGRVVDYSDDGALVIVTDNKSVELHCCHIADIVSVR